MGTGRLAFSQESDIILIRGAIFMTIFRLILISLSLLFSVLFSASLLAKDRKTVERELRAAYQSSYAVLQWDVLGPELKLELPKMQRKGVNKELPFVLQLSRIQVAKKEIKFQAQRLYFYRDVKNALHFFPGPVEKYKLKWKTKPSDPDILKEDFMRVLPISAQIEVDPRFWPPEIPDGCNLRDLQHCPRLKLPTGLYVYGGSVSKPKCLVCKDAEYSETARVEKIGGKVVCQLIIFEDGTVGGIKLIKSAGYGMDESVIYASSHWRFKPGMKDGKPVKVLLHFEVTFNIFD